ncbi:hypothetical protein QFZ82_002382 [Streptomyces sp. V4I23]|nr:hypothetical protein [Streptomyces sp. V4I23]
MITMTALRTNPLFARLESAERVLVAGAGGGFDVHAGLPIALSLIHQGKRSTWPTSRSTPWKVFHRMPGSRPTSPRLEEFREEVVRQRPPRRIPH